MVFRNVKKNHWKLHNRHNQRLPLPLKSPASPHLQLLHLEDQLRVAGTGTRTGVAGEVDEELQLDLQPSLRVMMSHGHFM
jgi:hypothetical protein